MWKVLNLYAGIGGNRKLWEDVKVTAAELNPIIAQIYQDHFPEDEMIITDACQFLLDNYEEYDFIWASPPCPSHSLIRKNVSVRRGQVDPIYPDMSLYQIILFLQGYFTGSYCVENVVSWYEPLITPQEVARHYFWANFIITQIRLPHRNLEFGIRKEWEESLGFDLSKYTGIRKDQILRNCVLPKLGKHILDCARNKPQKTLTELVEKEVVHH